MNFSTIRIEGSILSPDILDKIEADDISAQQAKDFGFDSKIKVKDEISKAWADANSQWKVFRSRMEKVNESETGTSETRKYWILPFLGLIGYELEASRAHNVNGKSYAISHCDVNLDQFPVHIVGFNDSLDRKRLDSGPRMSPHSLLQEYLNLTEHLYGIVSNGLTIRLLRDSSRLVKLSYIEFDLEQMFEEEHFTDFAVLYRLLHASRMPVKQDLVADSIIERYHQDALDSGSRIRDGLSEAVENTLKAIGNGFLNNPDNNHLRELIDAQQISADQYHKYLLRVVYRLLFVMVIEERGLIYPEKTSSKLKSVYYQYYSIGKIRRLCEKYYLSGEKHCDYWLHILNCFKLFEDEKCGHPLEIKPLAGDLFSYDAIGELNNSMLSNAVVIEFMRYLNSFKSEATRQFVKVNYRSLNVEEFGSVYEGLLEYKPTIKATNNKYEYVLDKGTERSSSGSHYTPDELVIPLIKHSLDYIIEDKLKEKDPEKALLSITVCDVACGSGHILLNAARRIAVELAKVRTGEDQPSPSSFRHAIKDVIRYCIYGVDKNPLAVELCKIALWLESHNPGEPLNFLDHKIKCGDSIVGLAHKEELLNGIPIEAFDRMPDDDKDICSELKKKNKKEFKTRIKKKQIPLDFKKSVDSDINIISSNLTELYNLPETTPEEVETKKQRYVQLNSGADWWRLKNLADIQVAQFFIPKTDVNKNKIITDEKYHQILQHKQILGEFLFKATSISKDKYFFHWFLEFPEIFEKGGFDSILGNPPYLGGKKISGFYGNNFHNYITSIYSFSGGQTDLVSYFIRRAASLLNNNSFLSLITTNTVSQGDTKYASLDFLINNKFEINFTIPSVKWPGQANLEVSLISLTKKLGVTKYINNRKVDHISTLLNDYNFIYKPFPLAINSNISFKGSFFLGNSFEISNEEYNLISKDSNKESIVNEYLSGEDLTDRFDVSPSRKVINFHDWSEDKAKTYTFAYDLLKERAYPLAQNLKETNSTNIRRKNYWWQYADRSPSLYDGLEKFNYVFAVCIVSKYLTFAKVRGTYVYANSIGIIKNMSMSLFSTVQSTIHNEWARSFGSSLESRLRYTLISCFQSFPLPTNVLNIHESFLQDIGEQYHEYRKELLFNLRLGMTNLYNLFHSNNLLIENSKDKNGDIQFLYRHLNKTQNTISFNKAVCGLLHLRELHAQMDIAVLEAYGWTDIDLRHDFYEVDYLPENDRIRFTIHPDARKEILKRLLELNHKIHEEEVKAGLWDKKTTKTKKPKDNYPDSVNEAQGKFF